MAIFIIKNRTIIVLFIISIVLGIVGLSIDFKPYDAIICFFSGNMLGISVVYLVVRRLKQLK